LATSVLLLNAETHNKKEKANISVFYLSPNVIVLKRNQKFLKREIFTLAHELGIKKGNDVGWNLLSCPKIALP
jgi:Zn-dependent peptidase ImmA (M78 family)